MQNSDPYLYPRGRTRVEPLGSILVSVIMGVANVQMMLKAVHSILNNEVNNFIENCLKNTPFRFIYFFQT